MNEAVREDQNVIKLPERLDTKSFDDLKNLFVDASKKQDVCTLDASEVTYLGGLCLELIIASKFTIIMPSENMKEALKLFGASTILSKDVEEGGHA